MSDVQGQQNCSLLPYKRRDVLSAQDLSEKLSWGVSRFRIPEVWATTQGEGVTVAVLDTGCDLDHPDLVENLLPGYNFVDPGQPPDDDGEHGTHVTGIICAAKNNMGVIGVAPKCKVRPMKVLDGYGDGDIEHVVQAIRRAIDEKVDFISLSLGTKKPVRSLKWALKAAAKAGIVVFAAAGNIGKSEHLLYPANYKETISIGAIDKDLHRADFSNTGKNLDFMAPGVDILSTVPDAWWAILSGSSMAQPFVCGLAALLLSHKRAKGLSLKLSSADDYRNYFKKHTVNLDCKDYAGQKFYQGFGIITLDKLMEDASLIP